LNANDQIVALDGLRASSAVLQKTLTEKKPGDKVSLMVFRFDELRTIEIILAGRASAVYRFSAAANATDDQQRIYRDWLKADLVR
jgi:predicted metalloprotease with PDZ domain